LVGNNIIFDKLITVVGAHAEGEAGNIMAGGVITPRSD